MDKKKACKLDSKSFYTNISLVNKNEKEIGKANITLDDVYFKRKALTTGKDGHVLINSYQED